jgi:hypothetical protein
MESSVALVGKDRKTEPLRLKGSNGSAFCSELFGLDCFNGAVVSAIAAVEAEVGIDNVLAVTLLDCFNGAVLSAVAAGEACIGNLVSHFSVLHGNMFWYAYIVAYFFRFENTFSKKSLLFFEKFLFVRQRVESDGAFPAIAATVRRLSAVLSGMIASGAILLRGTGVRFGAILGALLSGRCGVRTV